jgi:iron-sulfur cluster assembly accessory protein
MASVTQLLPGDPGLSLTAKAIDHVKRALKEATQGEVVGLRLLVKKAGCSGYEYHIEYAYSAGINALDLIFEQDQVKLIVDKETYLKFLSGGTEIDFKREGLNEGLHFENPNVANQCGCGESFTLKSDAT